MKKRLLFLLALLLGFSAKTYATHDIGGHLEYSKIAPNTYVVTYFHYSWGGLGGSAGTLNLSVSSPGCSVYRTVPMQFQNQRHGGVTPNWTAASSYKISHFTATVVFTAAEVACGNVVLGVGIGSVQGSMNSTDTGSPGAYTEATLRLNAGQNSSPIFDPQNEPVLVAAPYMQSWLSVGAWDPDGDSLVYRMVAPLRAPNQPMTTYKTLPGPFTNPNPQAPYSNPSYPQLAFFASQTSYSPEFPILSYDANWASGQPICQATKSLLFDSRNGSISFTPMLFNASGSNFHNVSFQIDEYRKINGVVTKIGSVRRETTISVGNMGMNVNPNLSSLTVNNAPASQVSSLTIGAGSTLNLQLAGADANLADSVFLASNAVTVLPGATFNVVAGSRQSATLTWTPTAAQVRSMPYFLRIWVIDNAKPIAGRRVETIAVRVTNGNGVTGIKPTPEACSFYAYPNPFSQEVSFQLPVQTKASEVVIYNVLGGQVDRLNVAGPAELRWTAAAQFPAGTYVARLISQDKTVQTIKFTKLQ